MGDIYAKIGIKGKLETREFDFLVVRQARRMGMPQSDIDALGLEWVSRLSDEITTDSGPMSTPVYTAICTLDKLAFAESVIAMERHIVGANSLRDFGYKVDWEKGKLEKDTSPFAGPLDPWAFETLAQHTGMRYEIDLVNWHLTLYPADDATVTVVPPAPAGDSFKEEKEQSG